MLVLFLKEGRTGSEINYECCTGAFLQKNKGRSHLCLKAAGILDHLEKSAAKAPLLLALPHSIKRAIKT